MSHTPDLKGSSFTLSVLHLSDNNVDKTIHFLQEKKPNAKSDKEVNEREKIDFYLRGIKKFLEEELKIEDVLDETLWDMAHK